MPITIHGDLQDEIMGYPYKSATPYGGHSIHLWKPVHNSVVRYRPICQKQLVIGYDAILLGRTICPQCLKIARRHTAVS